MIALVAPTRFNGEHENSQAMSVNYIYYTMLGSNDYYKD